MLAVLLETPQTDDDWGRWAFHNQDQTQLIQQAIHVQYGVTLTPYILFPLNLQAPAIWLQNNQASHTDFNAVLGLQSHDLQEVDFNDADQLATWININYQEMMDASTALKI